MSSINWHYDRLVIPENDDATWNCLAGHEDIIIMQQRVMLYGLHESRHDYIFLNHTHQFEELWIDSFPQWESKDRNDYLNFRSVSGLRDTDFTLMVLRHGTKDRPILNDYKLSRTVSPTMSTQTEFGVESALTHKSYKILCDEL